MKLFDKFIDLFRVDEDNDEMTRKMNKKLEKKLVIWMAKKSMILMILPDLVNPSISEAFVTKRKMLNLDLNGYKKLIVTSLLLRILSVVFGGAIVLGSCFLSP